MSINESLNRFREKQRGELYTAKLQQSDDGQYMVRLPFRRSPPDLGNSKCTVYARFMSMENKFVKDPD